MSQPTVQGSYPSEAARQAALEGCHGPYLTSLEQLSTGGKNPAIGRLEHTASRYRWEVGSQARPAPCTKPGARRASHSRSPYRARCQTWAVGVAFVLLCFCPETSARARLRF
jgi:hypothetical protein